MKLKKELWLKHRSKDFCDDATWNYIKQAGFWTERDHETKTLYIFVPETGNSIGRQKLNLLHAFDWLWNFLFIPIVGVHIGFFIQYLSYKSKVITIIKAFEPKKIYIVSYSQGGGNSAFLHVHLKKRKYDVESYSYGAPRAYTVLLALIVKLRGLDKGLYRIVNGSDIVTKVPLMIFTFMHIGKKVQIGKRKFVSVKDHTPDEIENSLIEAQE